METEITRIFLSIFATKLYDLDDYYIASKEATFSPDERHPIVNITFDSESLVSGIRFDKSEVFQAFYIEYEYQSKQIQYKDNIASQDHEVTLNTLNTC